MWGRLSMVLRENGGRGAVPLASSVIVKASMNGFFRSWGLAYKKQAASNLMQVLD